MKTTNYDSATSLQFTNNETSLDTTTNPSIENQYGRFTVNPGGYYQNVSYDSPYYGQYLHRLIWMETHKQEIPDNCDIHHVDENKTNNAADNLVLIERSFHRRLHTLGEKNPMYGKHHSLETREKISKANTKTEARIIKNGHTRTGKQRYQLKANGQVLGNSTDYEKLEALMEEI